MLVDFLFYFIFAAIARGPLAFATRWIWAADVAESIETAAVRAPLCLRFPLLLGSVQAGVGLLSPPPTRRCGFILWFSRVWRKLLQLLGLPPLPTLSGLRRARAFRQLRPRRAMPRLHGFLPRRMQLVLGYSDPTVVPPDHVATTFPFGIPAKLSSLEPSSAS